ncbi:CHRD domain-containing protein [Streptomyces beijiangensis]|uniref:CHRD domain-containing protein n=1 Tax=Streptomyces beijiangensis TaxID=163361 RepID=A0A939F5Q9_9ACTN|nr:CHRD domain-containing protein [Streptomyces beijiangensis]MBO0512153.1 CHRD domain-containing protein [Streptomyces beijiangensis]
MKRTKVIVIGTTAVAAAAGIAFAVLPASADSGNAGNAGHAGHQGHGAAVAVESDTGSSGGALFVASMRGANEIPVKDKPAVGDPDGTALELIQVKGDQVSVTVNWRATGRPTMLHIHQGARGTNGDVKIDFSGLLAHSRDQRVTGTVQVTDAKLLDALKTDPASFYANLHTEEFPGGAVRGQLHAVTRTSDFLNATAGFQASVVQGQQIYECKKGDDGKFAFLQRDVRATLAGDIQHFFTAPNSGVPSWHAQDGSAVTGAVISKTPNGERNIAELDLKAAQAGSANGLLSRTAEIFRLNTVGGVAPTGTCDPGAVVGVPYFADYVFVPR